MKNIKKAFMLLLCTLYCTNSLFADTKPFDPSHTAPWYTWLWHNRSLCSTCQNNAELLLQAVKNGDIETVKQLLAQNVSFKETDADGNSALHLAIIHKQEEILELFQKHNLLYTKNKTLHPFSDRPYFADSRGFIEIRDTNKIGNTPLHLAAEYGMCLFIEKLLSVGALIEHKNKRGETSLFLAAEKGKIDAFDTLIGKQAQLDTCDMFGQTVAHAAARHDHIEILKKITEQKKELFDAKDKDGDTPLLCARKNRKNEAIKYLVQHCSNPDEVDEHGRTLLHYAIENDNDEFMEKYINLIKKADNNGLTPLVFAVQQNNKKAIEFLITKGADIKAKTDLGNSALHYAVAAKSSEYIDILIKAGADINQQNNEKRTPLMRALVYFVDDTTIAQQLLAHKNHDFQLADKWGDTVLHLAAIHNKPEAILQTFAAIDNLRITLNKDGKNPLHCALDKKAFKNARFLMETYPELIVITDAQENTPLMLALAASCNDLELVKLSCNPNLINKQNKNGHSALHKAARHSSSDIVKMLLDMGAQEKLVTENQNTPLHWACIYRNSDAAALLSHNPHTINTRNYDGETPISCALDTNSLDMIDALCKNNALDITIPTKNGMTTVHKAVRQNNREFLDYAAKKLSAKAREKLFNAKDNAGHTPLEYAFRSDHFFIITNILSHGANINVLFSDGLPALYHAIEKDKFDWTIICLKYKASVHYPASCPITPLIHAEKKRSLAIAKLLLEHNVEVNEKDKAGNTALYYALVKYNPAFIELIAEQPSVNLMAACSNDATYLQTSIDVGNENFVLLLKNKLEHDNFIKLCTTKNKEGMYPLLSAVQNGHLAAASILIDAGVPLTQTDASNNNVLHWAARNGHTQIMKSLANKGMNFNAQNNDGNTPLHTATAYNHENSVRYLLDNDADWTIRNKEGKTPADLAGFTTRDLFNNRRQECDNIKTVSDRVEKIRTQNQALEKELQQKVRDGHLEKFPPYTCSTDCNECFYKIASYLYALKKQERDKFTKNLPECEQHEVNEHDRLDKLKKRAEQNKREQERKAEQQRRKPSAPPMEAPVPSAPPMDKESDAQGRS
jgi:ankyrin repeat protein